MGATKRLAELVATYQRSRLFRPVVVRFGNILGSSGSVVEIMAEAVQPGPQHPGDRSIGHALLHDRGRGRLAGHQGRSHGPRRRCVLAGHGPGAAHRRSGAAHHRVGTRPKGTTPVGIDIIGLRAGEKLREELTTQGLEMKKTSHPRIWSARQKDVSRQDVIKAVRQIRRACAAGDATMALDAIAAAVPDYEPSETAIKAARSASRRVGAPSSKITTAVA